MAYLLGSSGLYNRLKREGGTGREEKGTEVLLVILVQSEKQCNSQLDPVCNEKASNERYWDEFDVSKSLMQFKKFQHSPLDEPKSPNKGHSCNPSSTWVAEERRQHLKLFGNQAHGDGENTSYPHSSIKYFDEDAGRSWTPYGLGGTDISYRRSWEQFGMKPDGRCKRSQATRGEMMAVRMRKRSKETLPFERLLNG
ncbi:hypothetical protein C8R44DRAFT_749141 [Mycena epipterygia]|nr:hypothetical protein C8R44DRAFT_749141 [Mycena epipterygia]